MIFDKFDPVSMINFVLACLFRDTRKLDIFIALDSLGLSFVSDVGSQMLFGISLIMTRNVRKRTFGHVRPAKIQISLRKCAGWSESSLGAFWVAKATKFLHADNEDSDQTVRKRKLFWIFTVAYVRR